MPQDFPVSQEDHFTFLDGDTLHIQLARDSAGPRIETGKLFINADVEGKGARERTVPIMITQQ